MSYQPPGPPPGAMPPQQPPPNNWLVGAILAFLCCWPFGIPALVYSSRVNAAWNAGDYMGAEEAAANAKKWGIIAFVSGVLLYVVVGILWAVGVFALFTTAQVLEQELDDLESIEQDLEEWDAELEELEDIEDLDDFEFDTPDLDGELDDMEEALQELEDALDDLDNY